MHTFILTAALVTFAPGAVWESSYGGAQQQAAAQKKPLVIVFGSGANAWSKAGQTDKTALDVGKLMSEKYVCLYVDTTSPTGKKLAGDFDISSGVGMVISDRNGEIQAFWHQGDMSNENLVHYLTKFADPNIVVNRTETANTFRTSFYPQTSPTYSRPANC